MNRNRRRIVLGAAAAILTAGCNPAALSYFLFKGDGTAPPDLPLEAPDGKKTISVAILASAPNASPEFAGIDHEFTRLLSQIFVDQTREKKNPVRAVSKARIDQLKSQPGWKSMPPSEMARQLGADYLLDCTITDLGLYEPGTGWNMYQGVGTVNVVVYDAVHGKELPTYFVNAKMETKPADMMSKTQYRTLLTQRIAEEVSWKHLPHITDRRVQPVR
jgi:hypothetical protein